MSEPFNDIDSLETDANFGNPIQIHQLRLPKLTKHKPL